MEMKCHGRRILARRAYHRWLARVERDRWWNKPVDPFSHAMTWGEFTEKVRGLQEGVWYTGRAGDVSGE